MAEGGADNIKGDPRINRSLGPGVTELIGTGDRHARPLACPPDDGSKTRRLVWPAFPIQEDESLGRLLSLDERQVMADVNRIAERILSRTETGLN